MSASTKSGSDGHETPAAPAGAEDDVRRPDHITASLEAVQKDLAAIGASLGAGARDLGRDVTALLRDARRDLMKMRRAVERDLGRLQNDLTSVAKGQRASTPAAGSEAAGRGSAPAGHQSVTGFLDEAHVAHELIEHEPVMSASAESRVTDIPPDQVAKTIVLHDGEGYVLAAIPASERLDLHKLRTALGRTRRLALVGESEIARDFPGLEVGAMPPFGPLVPAVEVIDAGLTEPERVLCAAGDHRHSVLVDPRDIVRLTGATVADVSED
jgi:Ala-tRNA(Pro) deacylase